MTMVFLAEQIIPVPPKDLISWIFDEIPYDQDQPVSTRTFCIVEIKIFNVDCALADRF